MSKIIWWPINTYIDLCLCVNKFTWKEKVTGLVVTVAHADTFSFQSCLVYGISFSGDRVLMLKQPKTGVHTWATEFYIYK